MEFIVVAVLVGAGAFSAGVAWRVLKPGRRTLQPTREAWQKAASHFDLFHEEFESGPQERALRGRIADHQVSVVLERQGTTFSVMFEPPLPIDYTVELGQSEHGAPSGDERFDSRFLVRTNTFTPVSSDVRDGLAKVPADAIVVRLDAHGLKYSVPRLLCSLRELQSALPHLVDIAVLVERERVGGRL